MFNKAMIALCLLSFGASSCASISSGAGPQDRPGFSAEPMDFNQVQFKPGHPRAQEALADAIATPADLASLDEDFALLQSMPAEIPVRVVGSTDSMECTGDACVELSSRRAQAVHDWLIARGVPASRLSPPRGFGNERPIGDNATEEGRARNRRAYVSYEGTQ